MSTIEETLAERGKVHGNFCLNSRIAQEIKKNMRCGNWAHLTEYQQEALDMIAHKIGRILAGNEKHTDHWHDIAGYATLVEKQLKQ